ncbi:MAG: nicotinate (nicotinamide) nucleotide adenylyltransferase [Chloroflexi bacterium RBG_16_48_8]|nr:MAG: nicotinate (nicotinamide) nucleotide adenylyltransferase [Chloroflexi bacterium RBG_16_48_8]
MAGLIGVLGGTFDPPHIGHLILADEGRDALGLEKVFWVLTPSPPHKLNQTLTPLEYRLRMVQETIKDNPAFQLSEADIHRSPPHYSVGTMEWLAEHHPDLRFVFIMGSDSFRDLPTWHEPHRFVKLCAGLGVMQREGVVLDLEAIEREIPGISAKTHFFDVPMIGISGNDIRERVREGAPYRYLVPHGVSEIIHQVGLYL